MKSKLVSGWDFEYTLDDILQYEYSEYIYENYEINRGYLEEHMGELIKLRDVCVYLPATLSKSRGLLYERFDNDLDVGNGTLGLYQWFNIFSKIRGGSYEDSKEDYCRMFLDLVEKYPEHSEIIIKKE